MKKLKKSFINWIVVSLICLLLGFLLGKFKISVLEDSLAVMTANLQTTNSEKLELSKRVSGIEATLITDKQTIKLLTQENKKLNDQLNRLENKLYFYERVVAPEKQSSGVQIYSFTVDKNSETGLCYYELVLMQAQRGRRLLKGKFSLNFSVLENEDLQTIPITQLSDSFTPQFKFKYFQTIKGTFQLPAEMQVDKVMLTLSVAGDRWHKRQTIEQDYYWPTLIDSEDEDLMEFAPEKLTEQQAESLTGQ